MKVRLKEQQKEQQKEQTKKHTALARFFEGALKSVRQAAEGFARALGFELFSRPVDTKSGVKYSVLSMALCVVACFLSRCEMGECTYPLAVAILSASGKGTGKEVCARLIPALALGCVLVSTLFMDSVGVLYFSVLLVSFVLRAVISVGSFNESVSARTLVGFLTAFLVGTMWALISDFALLSLVSFAILVTTTPIFTFLFASVFDKIGDKRPFLHTPERYKIGLLGITFCLVFACRELVFFGVSLPLVFAYCTTLIVAKRYGAVIGGAVGLCLGLACAEGYFAATFGAIGIFCALFLSSELVCLCVSVLVGVVVSVFVGGVRGFLDTVPESLIGFLILVPILPRVPKKPRLAFEVQRAPGVSSSAQGHFLEKMSGSFSGLSEVFFAVCDCMRLPTRQVVEKIITSECNKICASCIYTPLCRGKKESETEQTIKKLTDTVMKTGKVSVEDFDDEFRDRCPRVESILRGINEKMSDYSHEKGALDAVNLIAGEYRTVSKLLKNSAQSLSVPLENDIEIKKRVSESLDRLGISHDFIKCYGGRNTVIEVLGSHPDKITCSTTELITTLENACKMKFEEPTFHLLDEKSVMEFKRRRAISLECAKSSCNKKGESTSGDTTAFFENELGKFYSVIADGMGSGREAALTSRLATIFLEKLLTCTDDKTTTVEMLNRMLLTKNKECFTTLDMVEIDLYEKKCAFIKAGACPSYVLRGEKTYKIVSRTPPAGIIEDFVSEETRVLLEDGDVIVLFSDGVADGEEASFLADIENECRESSAREVSDKILSHALSEFSARDDMSVVVIKVFEN